MARVDARPTLYVLAAVGVLSLGLSACGTRLPRSAFSGSQDLSASAPAGGSNATGNGSQSGASSAGAPSAAGTPGANVASGGAGANSGGTGGASGSSGGGVAGGPTGAAAGSGSANDVGVTASSITIGNVTSVQGALGPDAFGVSLPGLQAWVAATNASGGINGRKIILDTCDDSEDGQQNLACTDQLVTKDHVFALVGNNSDACASSAHFEYTQGVPDVGFPLCNGYYKYPNMFSAYGTGYPRKAAMPANEQNQANIYKWFAANRHVSKGAYFFYIIPISQQQGYAEETEAASVGIATTYEGGGSHEGENPADPTFDTDVINMRADKVDSVYDAMDVAGNEKLCAAMDRQGFTVKAKVSTVEVFGQSVGQWSSPCRDSVYSADSSAPYSDTSNPVVAQFRQAMSTYEPTAAMHQWALDGYALGILFGDAVSSMGAKVTRSGFTKWLDSWKQPQAGGPGYTFHGLMSPEAWAPLNYSKPAPACDSIAQWNDAAGTFVTVAGANTCYTLGWLPTAFSADGS